MLGSSYERRHSQPIQWVTLLAILAALATCVSEWLAIRRARIEAQLDAQHLEGLIDQEQLELDQLDVYMRARALTPEPSAPAPGSSTAPHHAGAKPTP